MRYLNRSNLIDRMRGTQELSIRLVSGTYLKINRDNPSRTRGVEGQPVEQHQSFHYSLSGIIMNENARE
jgi:hypothetical protein